MRLEDYFTAAEDVAAVAEPDPNAVVLQRLKALKSLLNQSKRWDDNDSDREVLERGRGTEAVERLWGAMRGNEQRMLKAMEESELTPNVPLLFAKSYPAGKSRTAAYCRQGCTHVHRLLLKNKPNPRAAHDGIARAASSTSPGWWRAGLGGSEEAVRVRASGGEHLGGRPDQRAEKGGIAGEKAGSLVHTEGQGRLEGRR